MKKHYYTDTLLDICNHSHLTVDEIFRELQKKFPEAGKSSVYRNVQQLAETGKLKKVIGLGKKTFFEKTKENHAHLICQKSGKIIDIPLPTFSQKDFPENFSPENIDLKIYGKIQ